MEKLKLNDFLNYKFLSSLKIGPDKKNTGFIGHKMNFDLNKYDSNIYLYNEDKKETKQVTTSNNDRLFSWQNDNTLVFVSTRDKKDSPSHDFNPSTDFYRININGGEAKKYFSINFPVTSFEFIDEDNLIITGKFDLNKEDFDKLSEDEKLENKDYIVFDELPFWANGQGYTNKTRNRTYTYNIPNKTVTEITGSYTDTVSYKLNKDRTKLVILSQTYEDVARLTMEVSIYDLETKKLREIDRDRYKYHYIDFLEDGLIALASDMKTYGLNENPHVYSISLGGSIKKLTKDDYDIAAGSSVGSDSRFGSYNLGKVDGSYLYFTTTDGYHSNLRRIDVSGNLETLTRDGGAIDGFDVLDGEIRFIGLRDLNLQEVYSLENGKETRLSSFNTWVGNERSLAKPEYISFKSEGDTIDGWVLKPVDYIEGRKYPTILNIHGGPKTVFGNVFFHEMQYWANAGYGVLFCNPKGSDGKGNNFADIRGKYGTIDYDQLMTFVDTCIDKYDFIDKDRLGVAGGSYGGFMTNWIIGHTDRFKAAASQRSISNWFSFYGTTDIGYFFGSDQQASSPWDNPEKLWFHSPMKYADKVTTPTLFIHSEEDYRCWVPEALQMFTALKQKGVDSRVCLFKGENHELSRSGLPKHRIRRLKEITGWFDKYLK